jgi:type I restriction enzyme S subunit
MTDNNRHTEGNINFPPSDWVETALGKVVEISSGKSRPKNHGLFPVYGGNGILGYADNFNFENETVIIGRVGAYCGCVYFEKEQFWLSDNALGIKSNEKSDIKFLYYFLINQNLNKKAIGGAQPLLTQGILKQIEIILPPLPEQQAIASVLSAFDDKIELLREQNKTLEEIGQTIYQEWFGKYSVDRPEDLPEGWRIGKITEIIKKESISYRCDKKDLDPK